jgi:hypothetical protein
MGCGYERKREKNEPNRKVKTTMPSAVGRLIGEDDAQDSSLYVFTTQNRKGKKEEEQERSRSK